MHEHLPGKVLVTVATLGTVCVVALAVGQIEVALVAAGGLAGYLGKVNGSP